MDIKHNSQKQKINNAENVTYFERTRAIYNFY